MQEFQAKIPTPPQKPTKASNISTFQKNPTPKAISPTLHAEQPKALTEKLDQADSPPQSNQHQLMNKLINDLDLIEDQRHAIVFLWESSFPLLSTSKSSTPPLPPRFYKKRLSKIRKTGRGPCQKTSNSPNPQPCHQIRTCSSGQLTSSQGREPYFLRPRGLGTRPSGDLGLDMLKEPHLPKVGRKSAIKHAQEKATQELCEGKQKLIIGIPRAGTTPPKVPQ